MRSIAAVTLTIWASASAAAAAQPTAAELVEKNAAARGGIAAWRKIETMAWTGRVESANRPPAPFLLEMQRPNRTRFELLTNGQKSMRIFDGAQGWKVRVSAGGRPDVQPWTAEEVRFARGVPLIEGPLMDYVAKGAAVSVDGMQDVEGHPAYALTVRQPSGASCRVWLDASTFLEVRYDRDFTDAKGRPAVTSVYFTNYKAVEGLNLPLTVETGAADGKTRDRLVIERIALNPALDAHTFEKPAPKMARHGGVVVDLRAGGPGTPAK